MVKAMATCNEGSLLKEMAICSKSPKNGNMIATPTRLNTEADKATNFDIGENFRLINNAVEVVPIFAPITIGMAD